MSEEELNGLTVYYAVKQYTPTSGIIVEGLRALGVLFGKLPNERLPQGNDWIDNLDIYDSLREAPFVTLKPFTDFYFIALSGYTIRGVSIGSDDEKTLSHCFSNSKYQLIS